MSFKARLTDDLVRIGAAGGGIRFEGKARLTDDLIRIAAATRTGGGMLTLTGMSARLTDDLLRIAAAGKGHVIFED